MLFLVARLLFDSISNDRIGAHLARNALLGLKVGDSTETVIRAIGYPLALDWTDPKNIFPAEHTGEWPKEVCWIYGSTSFQGIEIAIFFNDSHRLRAVSVRYDDSLIYRLTEENREVLRPDLIDLLPSVPKSPLARGMKREK